MQTSDCNPGLSLELETKADGLNYIPLCIPTAKSNWLCFRKENYTETISGYFLFSLLCF